MTSLRRIITALFLCAITMGGAQDLENKTLLTIDGQDYDAGTFMYLYLKNLDIVKDEEQKDIDNYLQLYIDYRIKLQQAYDLKLDEKEEYKKELLNYRNSIAQSYLTDNTVTDQLVREAFNRKQYEINASHILVNVTRTDTPADTLVAFNKIMAIKKSLDNGAKFDETARTRSEGPSNKNDGRLGWFGPFRMVYDFENEAYDTPVGEYSAPFRTDFGYHIVKVIDKRKARGEVTVAHIMTYDKKEDSIKTAPARIQEIYNQLKENGKFEELARELSDDTNSSMNGGKLNRFGTGGLNSATFVDKAFAIQNIGDYTQPFKTRYGWHIVKLLGKHPELPFNEMEKELKEKIKTTPRARKITQSFTDGLLEKYNISKDNSALLKKLAPAISDSIVTNNWTPELPIAMADEVLFNIEDKKLTRRDFIDYLTSRQKKDFTAYATKEEKIADYLKQFKAQEVIAYYDNNLYRDNKSFAHVYDEYKEGILLFNLLEEKIWNRAKTDTLGLKAYYNKHKEKYQWQRRLDIILTQNTSKDIAQQVTQLLEDGKTIDEIKKQFNEDARTRVIVSTGTVEETFNKLPQDFEIKPGVSKIYHTDKDNFYKVIKINKIMPPSPKTFEEARGAVINDYQQYLDKQWLESLRDGKKIKVHKRTLKKVKKEIAQRD